MEVSNLSALNKDMCAKKYPTAHMVTYAEDRLLTDSERTLLRWLLEHGDSGAHDFIPQIDLVRVAGQCGCGCATVDLAVDGFKGRKKGMSAVADFFYRTPLGSLCGAIVFVSGKRLTCLEIWSVDGQEVPSVLPAVDRLYPASEFKVQTNREHL